MFEVNAYPDDVTINTYNGVGQNILAQDTIVDQTYTSQSSNLHCAIVLIKHQYNAWALFSVMSLFAWAFNSVAKDNELINCGMCF